MSEEINRIDKVRASRAGHSFHERWAARRALQLVFPNDDLFAIAVEGISSEETIDAGPEAEDIADLVMYYGRGSTFAQSTAVQVAQFKYKVSGSQQTGSFLTKTILKFAKTFAGYEAAGTSKDEIDQKLSFLFVTNADLARHVWEAIECLKIGETPTNADAAAQYALLSSCCVEIDPRRLFSAVTFQAGTRSLRGHDNALRRTMADWSPGGDSQSRPRLYALTELVREKAGLRGQRDNLIKREDILDALGCEPDDLFPAGPHFVDVGKVVKRQATSDIAGMIAGSGVPMMITADGGVGKTVFVQTLADEFKNDFEVVLFDCFGGGAYRAVDQERHLPKVGLVQVVNELASRGLCDPLLPSEGDRVALLKAARRRLGQGVGTLTEQSGKKGIIIILDAADNAQIEADHRKDDAFPSLILASLSSDPIDGVKLLLTARPHRASIVVGGSTVQEFSLPPFSDIETRHFLESRRKHVSRQEFLTAFSRSAGNARVLEFLVGTWDTDVAGDAPSTDISVEQLIAKKCDQIFQDLRVVGWTDDDIKEFFAAISLLPPPVPLDELANALGWPVDQVRSAAMDLVPLLEIVLDGAMFRDEPTETYVRETYSSELAAQRAIATRLYASQSSSTYAAEALPRFLVVTNDRERAYELASSSAFPVDISSEHGRRKLRMARLQAAFRLALAEGDFDRVLQLSVGLAQVASANARGDEFVRSSPPLAIALGDRDAARRLFLDRSGWRGARNARLAVAYAFQGNGLDAEIQRERAIGWINWRFQKSKDSDYHGASGPESYDFASVLLADVIDGRLKNVDENLSKWNLPFALTVCSDLLTMLEQYERATGSMVLTSLAKFASTTRCSSVALVTSLLGSIGMFPAQQLQPVAKAVLRTTKRRARPMAIPFDETRATSERLAKAAFGAIALKSPGAAKVILKTIATQRPSSYDYGERYGPSRAWAPVLFACASAWASGNELSIAHLLPSQVPIERFGNSPDGYRDLAKFLADLKVKRPRRSPKKRGRSDEVPQFTHADCEAIRRGIQLVLKLTQPIGEAIAKQTLRASECLGKFLDAWQELLPSGIHPGSETAVHVLSRTLGIGFAKLLLQVSDDVRSDDAERLVRIVSGNRFTIADKIDVLGLLARRGGLQDTAGQFAGAISIDIDRDETIELRGENYLQISQALFLMSRNEAQAYYRKGLGHLDQMGAGDYDLVYSILNYAAAQPGGLVRPDLGHRLLNLAQAIFHHEPGKFGWTLFARAAGRSIGPCAVNKLLRWHDQGVANFAYGLPQLASFLARAGHLGPRRAAVILLLSENQGWNDWELGAGLMDILRLASNEERSLIFTAVLGKLKLEHPFGGWESLWRSLEKVLSAYPDLPGGDYLYDFRRRAIEASRENEEENRQLNYGQLPVPPLDDDAGETERSLEAAIEACVLACDPASASSIDEALLELSKVSRFQYDVRRRFLRLLRSKCPYDKRMSFLLAVCDATVMEVTDAINQLSEALDDWKGSTTFLFSQSKLVVERLFEAKGSQLFKLNYHGINREIENIAAICADRPFVIRKILEKIGHENVELSGADWLQVCTGMCAVTSPLAAKEALEGLLESPAARIADEIGEGKYREDFGKIRTQRDLVATTVWHLLGNEDSYVRWATARTIEAMAALGLAGELKALLELFDTTCIGSLETAGQKLSFQNSQQWLLLGLARASAMHGSSLDYLVVGLQGLMRRDDLHVVMKLSVARCLANIRAGSGRSDDKNDALQQMRRPRHGFVKANRASFEQHVLSSFKFDYDFTKSEVPRLAQMFNLPALEVVNLIIAKIRTQWPDANDMEYFPGEDRGHHGEAGRYESYRQHIQRHALLSVATDICFRLPVARYDYESSEHNPWSAWLRRYDVTFDDGTWVADHKDEVPVAAKERLTSVAPGGKRKIKEQGDLLRLLGLSSLDEAVPLAGLWTSRDGVSIRLQTALSTRRGAVGRCASFSQREDHEFWLGTCFRDGLAEQREDDPFEAWIWEPDVHGIGIDREDEYSCPWVFARPRLGLKRSESWGLRADPGGRNWTTSDGVLALSSHVWGTWEPDSERSHDRNRNDGYVLSASPAWLDKVLAQSNHQIVYLINCSRPRLPRSYETSPGLRASYVALRQEDGTLRIWHAKRASSAV